MEDFQIPVVANSDPVRICEAPPGGNGYDENGQEDYNCHDGEDGEDSPEDYNNHNGEDGYNDHEDEDSQDN